MEKVKIAVIEDEADILEVIEHNLEREGFGVITQTDGEEGLRLVRKEKPGLVLLDLMLPGLNGLEVCRKLREDPSTRPIPVIIVTAKGEESDIVLGLGIGADDYVTKPFSPRVLVERVKAVLRRGKIRRPDDASDVIRRDGLVINREKHEVRVDGKNAVLTATEFKLLYFLAVAIIIRFRIWGHVSCSRWENRI